MTAIINDTTSLAMIPKVVVGGIVNSMAKFTTKAPNRDNTSLNQNDFTISIVSIFCNV